MGGKIWKHRSLIYALIKRDVAGRYKGTNLGIIWSFLSPLATLLIYTMVFGLFFKSRWPESRTEHLSEFAVTLFGGLFVFDFFRECLSIAPIVILQVPNYVKKVVFPLEILPIVKVGSSLFHALISWFVFMVGVFFVRGDIPITAIVIPIVVLPIIVFAAGCSWILAAAGVFFRDAQHLIVLILNILFFATPILYSITQVPEKLHWLIKLNPLYPVIHSVRMCCLWGVWPDWKGLVMVLGISVLVAWGGFIIFERSRDMFADAL